MIGIMIGRVEQVGFAIACQWRRQSLECTGTTSLALTRLSRLLIACGVKNLHLSAGTANQWVYGACCRVSFTCATRGPASIVGIGLLSFALLHTSSLLGLRGLSLSLDGFLEQTCIDLLFVEISAINLSTRG